MNPRQFAMDFLARWETAKVSLDPDDNGNFLGKELIGSKWGVTPPVLARHRNVQFISKAQMAALTQAEAADIFLEGYFKGPNFHLLPWSRPVASMVDFAWGTSAPGKGPNQAVKLLQRMVDAPIVDGILTPGGETIKRYTVLAAKQPEIFIAGAWWTIRDTFYELVIEKNPVKVKYEKGWDNRSNYFTPGDKEGWWERWGR